MPQVIEYEGQIYSAEPLPGKIIQKGGSFYLVHGKATQPVIATLWKDNYMVDGVDTGRGASSLEEAIEAVKKAGFTLRKTRGNFPVAMLFAQGGIQVQCEAPEE